MRNHAPLIVAATAALTAACGILEPSTELEAANDTGTTLAVFAAPCGLPLQAFAQLAHGRSHIQEVEAGCWHLEAWTDDSRAGSVQVNIPNGTLHRVPFYSED